MGSVVRTLREEAGWSQEEFAARCGLHRTYVGCIERGEQTITIETAHTLAQPLGVSLAALFSRLEDGEDA